MRNCGEPQVFTSPLILESYSRMMINNMAEPEFFSVPVNGLKFRQ